ncbi:MAG: LON peptidase substrate-binding domain-containing protein [Myxococcota bacterium]
MADSPPASSLPEDLPVLPLREFVVFPYMTLPLVVARGPSVAAVEDALAADRVILLVAQRSSETTDPEPDDLHRIGTAALILRRTQMKDGRLKVLVQGLGRVRIDSFIDSETGLWARTAPLAGDREMDWTVEGEAITRAVRNRVEELLPLKNLPPEVLSIVNSVEKPGRLADVVASNLRLRLS